MVAEAVAAHLFGLGVVARARRVACYLSLPIEPGTGPTIAGLHRRDIEVLVPVIDGDHLRWARYDERTELAPGPFGIAEPRTTAGGPKLLAEVDLVIAPALAVDHAGHRLGRGGGYYDRALAEVTAPICAVVHADELLPAIPAEPHDVAVTMAVTETGVFRTPEDR